MPQKAGMIPSPHRKSEAVSLYQRELEQYSHYLMNWLCSALVEVLCFLHLFQC